MPKLFNDNITITKNGNVINNEYNDVYFRINKAIEESNYTYIKPANLTQINPKILEIGFGCGLNFILSKIEIGCEKFEYHAIEKNPISPQNLITIYNNIGIYNDNKTFIEKFLNEYKNIKVGKNTIQIENLKLVLYIGDVNEIIENIENEYNIIYYDGFSPSKNIDAWQQNIFEKLYNASTHNCKLLSFSASSIVKKSLSESGFFVNVVPGFMGKRESIIANPIKIRNIKNINSIAIIGGGIVGSTIAHFFAQHDFKVTVYDKNKNPFEGNSKNPVNLLKIKSKLAKDELYDFGIQSFKFACDYIDNINSNIWVKKNILHYNEKSNENFTTMLNDPDISSIFENNENHIKINAGGSICTKKLMKEIYKNKNIKFIQKKFDTLHGIKQLNYDYIIICLGSEQDKITPFHEKNVKIYGHCIELLYKNNFENINSQSYIAPINNDKILVGSSFIRDENHKFSQKDDKKIIKKLKKHITNNYQIEKKYFGTRINFSNNLPQIHNIDKNIITVNGMGSRGFTNSFIIAKSIKDILSGQKKNLKISQKIIGEIGFHRL